MMIAPCGKLGGCVHPLVPQGLGSHATVFEFGSLGGWLSYKGGGHSEAANGPRGIYYVGERQQHLYMQHCPLRIMVRDHGHHLQRKPTFTFCANVWT